MSPRARRRLVFATGNAGKVREMQELLATSGWRVERLADDAETFAETGETFAENARGKALFVSRDTDLPVLADDSGLEVDALGGEPGVRSARWVDPSMSQAHRNLTVLERLAGLPDEKRGARFVCHLVLAWRGRLIHETRGTCEGRIADAPRGEGGFGYDPVFLVPELSLTFAEIGTAEKSARSHRGQAARRMARFLESWRPRDPA